MSQVRTGLWLGCWAAAWFSTASLVTAADIFLAPRLTLAVGYDDNRFSTASALTNSQNSAFLRVTPVVGLHVLTDNGAELSLGAAAARTDYLQPDFESRATADAWLEWWQTSIPFEGGLRLAGGLARDDAVTADDLHWLSAIPSLRYTLPRPDWQATAQAQVSLYDYDESKTAAGEAQRDFAVGFRPGLRWLPSRDLSIWAEAVFETCDSNEDTASYDGFGLAGGATYWLTPRDQLSAGFQAGTRTFQTYTDASGIERDRQDTPLSADAAYTHRFSPWLEFFCSASWQTTGSNQADQKIETASVQIGINLADDFLLFARHPSGW